MDASTSSQLQFSALVLTLLVASASGGAQNNYHTTYQANGNYKNYVNYNGQGRKSYYQNNNANTQSNEYFYGNGNYFNYDKYQPNQKKYFFFDGSAGCTGGEYSLTFTNLKVACGDDVEQQMQEGEEEDVDDDEVVTADYNSGKYGNSGYYNQNGEWVDRNSGYYNEDGEWVQFDDAEEEAQDEANDDGKKADDGYNQGYDWYYQHQDDQKKNNYYQNQNNNGDDAANGNDDAFMRWQKYYYQKQTQQQQQAKDDDDAYNGDDGSNGDDGNNGGRKRKLEEQAEEGEEMEEEEEEPENYAYGLCKFDEVITITGTMTTQTALPRFVRLVPKLCSRSGQKCTEPLLKYTYINLCDYVENEDDYEDQYEDQEGYEEQQEWNEQYAQNGGDDDYYYYNKYYPWDAYNGRWADGCGQAGTYAFEVSFKIPGNRVAQYDYEGFFRDFTDPYSYSKAYTGNSYNGNNGDDDYGSSNLYVDTNEYQYNQYYYNQEYRQQLNDDNWYTKNLQNGNSYPQQYWTEQNVYGCNQRDKYYQQKYDEEREDDNYYQGNKDDDDYTPSRCRQTHTTSKFMLRLALKPVRSVSLWQSMLSDKNAQYWTLDDDEAEQYEEEAEGNYDDQYYKDQAEEEDNDQYQNVNRYNDNWNSNAAKAWKKNMMEAYYATSRDDIYCHVPFRMVTGDFNLNNYYQRTWYYRSWNYVKQQGYRWWSQLGGGNSNGDANVEYKYYKFGTVGVVALLAFGMRKRRSLANAENQEELLPKSGEGSPHIQVV